MVVNALAYCTGDTFNSQLQQRFQIAAVPVPNKQFGFVQSMEKNGNSVTEGFWPRDHDVNLTPQRYIT